MNEQGRSVREKGVRILYPVSRIVSHPGLNSQFAIRNLQLAVFLLLGTILGLASPALTDWDLTVEVWTCETALPSGVSVWWARQPSAARPVVEFLRLNGLPSVVRWLDRPGNRPVGRRGLAWLACPAAVLSDGVIQELREAVRTGTTLVTTADTWDARLADVYGVRVEAYRWTVRSVIFRRPDGADASEVPIRPRRARRVVIADPAGVEVWATTGRPARPLIVRHPYGDGAAVLIGFPADELWSVRPDRLDGWVFRYLTAWLPVAVAAPLRHTAVLRMDDPQTSSKIWNTEAPPRYQTRYAGLTAAEWAEIGRLVGVHQARLSVMYVSGFVDDGDGRAGALYLQGRPVADRACGRIYDVRDVTYRLGDRVYDFSAEFQALRDLVARDVVDIESHGYIHTTPFLQEWCRDPQRPRRFLWISEFFDLYMNRPVPEATQQSHLQASIDRIRRWFGRAPVAFSPPMHAYDEATPVIAQRLGLAVMHAQTLFDLTRTPILETARLIVHWAHLPYVEDSDLNESGYPVVIGLHEWDLRTHVPPIRWIHHQIAFFQHRGYRRIISFRELVGYLGAYVQARYRRKSDREEVVLTVRIDRTGGPGGPESRFFSGHPMRWTLYAPGRDVVRVVDGQGRGLNYYVDAPGVFTVEFPPFGSQSEQTMTVTLKRS